MNGVTAAVGAVALVLAGLIATVGRMQWPRVTAALTLTGVAGLMNSTVGPFVHTAATTVDGWMGRFVGQWTGTVVLGLLGVVVIAVAGFWIWQGRIDLRTLGVTALVPPTVTLIPGAVGGTATTVVGAVPMVVGAGIAWIFGIG